MSKESSHTLLPIKFVLLIIQVLLLVMILLRKTEHINNFVDSTDSGQAEKQLMGVTTCWMALSGFEFLMMVFGTSVPPCFAKCVLL